MKNPYKIDGPAVIAFSGGRTSGYMLWKILEAHGGKLPDDVIVMFANTGREREETIKFVHDCETHWNVPIIWVEYRPNKGHAIVNYETADRTGIYFETLIREKKYLPNPLVRFCTAELKIRPMNRVVSELKGWSKDDYIKAIGIRADEPKRVARIRNNPTGGEGAERVMPIADAGEDVWAVLNFWKTQPFDLNISYNHEGISQHGNCDLCFLKRTDFIMNILREPGGVERGKWWARLEEIVTEIGQTGKSGEALFRVDRPSFRQMVKFADSQGELFAHDDESLISCECTD